MAEIYGNYNDVNQNDIGVNDVFINTLSNIIGNPILLNQFPEEYQQQMIGIVMKETCKRLDAIKEREDAETLSSNVLF